MVTAPIEPAFSAAAAIAVALTWVWLGMVLAISFLETPLKFRAPGVTLPIGLGIGRIVFRALNIAEAVLALGLVLCVLLGPAPGAWPVGIAVIALLIQLVVVRPRLTRRTNEVLEGRATDKRSRTHLVYVALELVKVIALIVAGVTLLT